MSQQDVAISAPEAPEVPPEPTEPPPPEPAEVTAKATPEVTAEATAEATAEVTAEATEDPTTPKPNRKALLEARMGAPKPKSNRAADRLTRALQSIHAAFIKKPSIRKTQKRTSVVMNTTLSVNEIETLCAAVYKDTGFAFNSAVREPYKIEKGQPVDLDRLIVSVDVGLVDNKRGVHVQYCE